MRTRVITVLATLIALCATGGTDLFAQRWQNLHGDTSFSESGRYGVQPVTVGGGYIAVGTSDAPATGGNTDVFVVRVDCLGFLLWGMTYDITGNGSNDFGNCIVESLLNPGTIPGTNDFAITGYTTDIIDYCSGVVLPAPNIDVFFLRIDAAGGPVIASLYGRNDFPEGGEYIRECQFGDLAMGNSPGDFIISGFCEDATSRDGYLLRVGNFGALIWDGVYGGNGTDYFQGCLESQFGPAVGNGDIVAVGGSDSYSAGVMNGFVVRCNGNNGFVVNAGTHGAGAFTQFSTVEELGVTYPGDLVMAGGTEITNSAGVTSLEFYVLRTTPDVCVPVVHSAFGDLNTEIDEYWTVKEIRGAATGTPFGTPGRDGNIVISGRTYSMGNGNDDAILHELVTANLTFAAGGVGYKAYGNTTEGQGAWSVHPVVNPPVPPAPGCSFYQGFILCGYWTPYATAANFDPSQLYLIKTGPIGNGGGRLPNPCNWWNMTATWTVPPYNTSCIWPWKGWIMQQCPVWPASTSLPQWVQLCFNNPKEALPGEEGTEIVTAYVYPNPIAQGTPLTVQYGIPEAARATITVADIIGGTVFTTTLNAGKGRNEYQLRTDDLAPGAYVVTVTADGVNTSQKFVVSEK